MMEWIESNFTVVLLIAGIVLLNLCVIVYYFTSRRKKPKKIKSTKDTLKTAGQYQIIDINGKVTYVAHERMGQAGKEYVLVDVNNIKQRLVLTSLDDFNRYLNQQLPGWSVK